jgi:hypothetical protein
MNAWKKTGLRSALDDSEKLLMVTQTLNMALGADKVAILPDDVLNTLHRMTHIIEQMQHTVVKTKSPALRRPNI